MLLAALLVLRHPPLQSMHLSLLTFFAILLFSAAILRSAAVCSLLPFLYFDILLLKACICLSSADSLCAMRFSFLFSLLAPCLLACLTFFAILLFSAAILRIAALCSL